MKKIAFPILATLFFVSSLTAQHSIFVTNNLGIDRKAEIVEVNLSDLNVSFDTKLYVLKNNQNKEVPYQLIYNGNKRPQSLIFQIDVKPNSTIRYSMTEGKPSIVKPKTFARFVPERKDDFAWENDMAAYRMYGPALANENPSNGVDFWAKCTDNLVIDQRYRDDIYNKISYHIDHGLGLDFYKVAHTMGCGGIAPFIDNKLCIGNHFTSYKVIEVGPLRSEFKLIYDSVKIADTFYKEEIIITTNAGSILNKACVKYIGANKKMELAAGIYLHDGKGILKQDVSTGISVYAEEAVSDYKVPAGSNYVGVYIPTKVIKAFVIDGEALMTNSYNAGDTFTYYFGGGWSKWHFPTDESWNNAVNNFREALRNPLKITVR
ncbi:MAG: DUF4861 family protein [Paludibacter sp.]|nr:DUF4861 family protein [Paludibacter sp.]